MRRDLIDRLAVSLARSATRATPGLARARCTGMVPPPRPGWQRLSAGYPRPARCRGATGRSESRGSGTPERWIRRRRRLLRGLWFPDYRLAATTLPVRGGSPVSQVLRGAGSSDFARGDARAGRDRCRVVSLAQLCPGLQTFRDSIWAAFFAANVRFADIGTDYFARNNPPSPLQHFWTLAVEEQFYVVWPALLALAVVGLRWRHPRGSLTVDDAAKRRLAALLVVGIGMSLAFSIHETSINPVGAYFSTFARAWELAVGALVAVAASQLALLPRWIRAFITWAGLAGVCAAAMTYTSQTPFPGYAALLPVLATALVVIGGLGAAPAWGAGRLLGRQPLRLIGDVSFGFYLWHWPILVIPAEYLGHPLSVATNLMLLLGAFTLSVATYWLFENPLRYSDLLERSRSALALWPVTVGLVILVANLGIGLIEYRVAPSPIFFAPPQPQSRRRTLARTLPRTPTRLPSSREIPTRSPSPLV